MDLDRLDIILPLILLVATLVFKILIAEEFKPARIVSELCGLPTDMIFLSISFLIAVLISSDGAGVHNGLLYLFIFFCISAITVALSKLSAKGFINNNSKWWILLLVSNFIISGYCLKRSISTIPYPDKETKTKQQQGQHQQEQQSTSNTNKDGQ